MLKFNRDRFSFDGPHWIPITSSESHIYGDIFKAFKNSKLYDPTDKYTLSKNDGLELNSSNLLIQGSEFKFISKIIPNISKKHLQNQLQIYSFIKANNLPGPILADLENPFIQLANGYTLLFLEYIDGRYYKGHEADLIKSSEAIDSFHSEFKHFAINGLEPIETLQDESNDILNLFSQEINNWDAKLGKETTLLIKNNWNYIKDCEKESRASIRYIQEQPLQALHIDLHPHNLLLNDSHCFILDIDSIKQSHWPTSTGFGMFKLLRQSLVLDHKKGSFIKNSNDFTKTLSKNHGYENIPWELLFLGAKTEILRRLLIILKGNVGNNISPWNMVLAIQINALSEVEKLKQLLI